MDGMIAVDSEPGLGSTFRFQVKMHRAPDGQAAEEAVGAAPVANRRLRVLLAEDNPTNRHVATRMLTRMGHAVDAVEDGVQAIAAATKIHYDVILMDMMMPEVDGIAATRAIRAAAPPHRDTVIIGVTANTLASDRDACEAAGMDGFVSKPVTLERLRAALEQTTRRDAPTAEPGAPTAMDTTFLRQLAEEISPSGAAEVVHAFLEDAPRHMAAIGARSRGPRYRRCDRKHMLWRARPAMSV